jgi:hypothetical protein
VRTSQGELVKTVCTLRERFMVGGVDTYAFDVWIGQEGGVFWGNVFIPVADFWYVPPEMSHPSGRLAV